MKRYLFLALSLAGLLLTMNYFSEEELLSSDKILMPLRGTKEHENRWKQGRTWVPGFSLDRGLRLKPNTQQGFPDETSMSPRLTEKNENPPPLMGGGEGEGEKGEGEKGEGEKGEGEKKGFSGENNMVLIPAGEFIMGSESPGDGRPGYDYGVDEEPRHKVHLNAFYIDKYEVTIGEYREFLKATGREWIGDSFGTSDIPEGYPQEPFYSLPDISHYPVNYVSWHDADEYCRWKGKRLPTEGEWEKAARGPDGLRWPWGNKFVPSNARVEENSRPAWIAPVGSHIEDKSPYSVYDMSGNVSEWTASYYLPYPGNKYDDGRYSKNAYVLKGGSFLLPGRLYGRGAARSLAYAAYNHRMYGIRCARNAS